MFFIDGGGGGGCLNYCGGVLVTLWTIVAVVAVQVQYIIVVVVGNV